MTSSDPDVIRRQIEDTRRELSYDVDALNEKVNPARVVDRRVTAAKGRVTEPQGEGHGQRPRHHLARRTAWRPTPPARCRAPPPAQRTACRTRPRPRSAPCSRHRTPIVRQTQGNPLAAGLIAFGVGWLVSSLLPASEKEKQLAQQAETAVKENKDALLEPAKQAAQEIGDQLKPAAQQAVESVKATAQDAATTVKDEGQSAAAGRAGPGPAVQGRRCRARRRPPESAGLIRPALRSHCAPPGSPGGAQCCPGRLT